ncbi:polyamine ABC transporter substrate-binding protein [Falsiroseomonas bella]|uniref:Polyamine ABC transporter substrate-binding protein n=1 Tax=Falsiroseomonas bella TaxID=2184016 RepID=A0A317F608_9PROT|nr:ABC transporter permease [Falsiroseomonas bella]PWS34641.1 polyamine ABC transporter substrate-binding protein [Falsiroseomonas bella]
MTDRELSETLPRTRAALAAWDGQGLPPETAFAALAQEAASALEERRIGALAQRLNFERSGLRALLLRTARAHDRLTAPYSESLPALDARWSDPEIWRLLQRAAGPTTSLYLLRALDLTRTAEGEFRRVDPEQAVFVTLFLRTLWVSVVVTGACLLLGWPVAACIAALRPPWSSVALLLVLMPFWSSVLVRSTAWFALLQREGPVNDLLILLGIVDAPLQLVGTRVAVLLSTIHILLPVAILPMVGVMTRLDRRHLLAAASLGAGPWLRFRRVWLPLSLPGILAGGAMTFLLAVGFYITPALLGGEKDQLVAWFIAQFLNRDVNWGMAAALSAYLLAMAGAVVALLRVLTGGTPTGARI